MTSAFIITAIVCYAFATWQLLQRLQTSSASQTSAHNPVAALLALLFHGVALYQFMLTPGGVDIGFFSAFSFTSWLVSLLLVLASLRQPVECLGILVFPLSAASLLMRMLSSQQHLLGQQPQPGLELHILFSILAYSLLSVAVAQAILLYIQDNHLHNRHSSGLARALPPLETMEKLLFQMIGLGFFILSLALASGFIYLENMFAQHLVHKTILSIIAWCLFAVLLWGRKVFGWRGRTAIRWTISAFVLLMLAYFGSKFVLELVLQR